ncbi:tRNA preQ1(34) S-adenosylmethionine ribosyltransferase-isomerase QueA [Beijerinckiaceae bacterium]|nr:tRNA preQ1(34) S-adenosylmethionine ribosyltransferase-isomerase QueA [Beijerinckiaceae bacterium]
MRVNLFDFELPPDRIALRPADPRDTARLLIVRPQDSPSVQDSSMLALPALLAPGDVLVVNDTQVIPARLEGFRTREDATAGIEATLHKREGPALWRAFVRPAKKLKRGETVRFLAPGDSLGASPSLDAEIAEKGDEGEVLLSFALSGAELDEAIDHIGQMPLPPYIAGRRPTDSKDSQDYQTLFARRPGAVAAPTASLHFTPRLLSALTARGVAIEKVTLHVGAGTFLPVKAEDTTGHKMHSEWGEVSAATAAALNKARAAGARVVAVGTTSLRILESATRQDGRIEAFSGETAIFITPGYEFKAVDVLLTNFHLPRSTLFMLAAAFSGLETVRAAYAHAIAQNYRFYSYGDACLLFPEGARRVSG